MKRGILFLLALVFLASCTVASPLTTTKNWLEAMKNNNYDGALNYMEVGDKDKFMNEFRDKFGKVVSYEIQNAIPLASDELKKLNAVEGNSVYYKVVFEKNGGENKMAIVVKRNGDWKIVY